MPDHDLILASSSPRRRDFVQKLGFRFKIVVPDIDEASLHSESADRLALRLAEEKCAAVAKDYPGDVVLAADTVVCVDGRILGKPRDTEDARAMLRLLSGREHLVMTGVCVQKGSERHSLVCTTSVLFDELPDRLLDEYLKSGESLDKSGSYAVQGIAAMFVLEVRGSVSSVVGLPVAQTRQLLEKFGLYYKYTDNTDGQ